MSYTEITFHSTSGEINDVLIALLADAQYEGFEETEDSLKAFIKAASFNKEQLDKIAGKLQLKYVVTQLPDTNWNKEWESNFQPVIVENFCAIRADFHQPIKTVQHEIIITPKMSFGTGHHATTFMMIQQMQHVDFENKRVMDFGTGTGVLAILAEKLGASSVIAIDNDEWSIDNAAENFQKNNINSIDLKLADKPINIACDIILANITRNIILENFYLFNEYLASAGILLLSGLLSEDETVILSIAAKHDFELIKKLQKDNWISLKLMRGNSDRSFNQNF